MKIACKNELIELNQIFQKLGVSLYVVGGFVRDSLLNLNPTDIDLASSLTTDQIVSLLKDTGFLVKLGSKKLGTILIYKNDAKFEHTTFRKESYKKGGHHTPEEVYFIKDIKTDALRRDFTINSLYYDITNDQIIDYFNGLQDLKNKEVKAIVNPKMVFQSDGLRILRMIRIAAELGFSVERKTYEVAKKMAHQLSDVTKDRLFQEFKLILNEKNKYGFENSVAIEQLIDLGAIYYIFKDLLEFSSKKSNNLANELFYLKQNSNLQFERFLLDVGIYFSKQNNKKASVILSKILNVQTSGVSIKERKYLLDLVKAYEQSKKCKSDVTARKFLQDHIAVIEPLFLLLNNKLDYEIYEKLNYNYNYMKEHKIPLSLKELSINGHILKEELKEVNEKEIGKLLLKALKFCAENKKNNTKTNLLTYLKNTLKEKKQ